MSENKGLRFNEGKVRYDLLEPFAQEQKARIFTKGAMKYDIHNWLKGMSWSKCYASALRHAAAYARGEDYDIDHTCLKCIESKKTGIWSCTTHTGELHTALAAWNWDAITSYYKHFPQGDDRLHVIMSKPKIGLDIDEVLCNWVEGWTKKFNLNVPTSWFFDYKIKERFDQLKKSDELDDFYLNLNPLIKPEDIPFEPHCYVTSRPVHSDITKEWLNKHGYPLKPVITVPINTSKVQVIKDAEIDIFVDDRWDNYNELNNNGICCYLFDSPHNQRYYVGHKRIKSLKDLPFFKNS